MCVDMRRVKAYIKIIIKIRNDTARNGYTHAKYIYKYKKLVFGKTAKSYE
jgi:hypothetical protein